MVSSAPLLLLEGKDYKFYAQLCGILTGLR